MVWLLTPGLRFWLGLCRVRVPKKDTSNHVMLVDIILPNIPSLLMDSEQFFGEN